MMEKCASKGKDKIKYLIKFEKEQFKKQLEHRCTERNA
jgi:hypothetical protein